MKMKKINLKNILKKTFKNKNKKKKKVSKKFKVYKVKKSKKLKIKTPTKKEKITKEINKADSLRIPKANELKPEIKKIKKQETEKKEYKPKDYVVYPKHGVGQILSVNAKTIGGIEVQCYDIKFEKDKAIGLLPINKQSHLRPLATINQINKSISILKSKPKIKRSMWSRRAQEYEQKITSGKIYDLAEVVRDLNKGDDIMVDQSYSERQLFEKAYERILSEFQIVMDLSLEDTKKKLDKALKRNLEIQTSKVEIKTEEPVVTPE
jgi:CarD family transcriptional regulator